MIVRPLRRTTPREAVPSPAITRRMDDLPCSVGPEQCEDLAAVNLKPDIVEDLDISVGKVNVVHLQDRDPVRFLSLTLVLSHLLLEFGDDQ